MLNLEHFNKYKHPFKESYNNLKLIIKSIKRYFFDNESQRIFPNSEYQLVFNDFFQKLDTEHWNIGQPWGEFHPDNLNQYYGLTDEFVYTTNEGLNLSIKNKTKFFYKKDLPEWQQNPNISDLVIIPVGVGLVISKISWQYGWFEAMIKLPEGSNYWPAFWLTGTNSWPPEIDILEGYSNETPRYGKKMLGGLITEEYWKIQPNLHYGNVDNDTKKDYGSYNSPVKNCTERFIQYVCHWEKEFIRIYYDGFMVFECKDPEVLKWFNDEKSQMNVVFNQGRIGFNPILEENPIIIKSFRVLQKK